MDPGSQLAAPLPTTLLSALLNLGLEGKLNPDSPVGIPRGATHARTTLHSTQSMMGTRPQQGMEPWAVPSPRTGAQTSSCLTPGQEQQSAGLQLLKVWGQPY